MQLTELQAEVVWLTLVEFCGANRTEQDAFVYHAQQKVRGGLEYRFKGALGFGGKIRLKDPPAS